MIDWLISGSHRIVVPELGPGDFDPYRAWAAWWVRALGATTVVELGVRTGISARSLLAGVHATEGYLWGVDLVDEHGIDDPRFVFVHADAADVANHWHAIDLLHIDTTPHTIEQTRRWLELYAAKCGAIALHDSHHPDFGVGAAIREFIAAAPGKWLAFEHWGNPSGWTVLIRQMW